MPSEDKRISAIRKTVLKANKAISKGEEALAMLRLREKTNEREKCRTRKKRKRKIGTRAAE